MAATVVWCHRCKTAVWAYDHLPEKQDIRGLMNMMAMPCPECGAVRNFDGWSGSEETITDLIAAARHEHYPDIAVYDSWSVLRYIFLINVKNGTWAISPDCRWFNRPESGAASDKFPDDLTNGISDLIKATREVTRRSA